MSKKDKKAKESQEIKEVAFERERANAMQVEMNELRDKHDQKKRTWQQTEMDLKMQVEALKLEVKILSEMHVRVMLRVQAESAAYAKLLPPEELESS